MSDVEDHIFEDRSWTYAPYKDIRSFKYSIQGTVEKYAINRRGVAHQYYLDGTGHGLYTLTEPGISRLRSLLAQQAQQRADDEITRKETEQRNFFTNRANATSPPDWVEVNSRRFVRDYPTGNRLKGIYGYSCQVCGITIPTPDCGINAESGYAEIHHIRPLGSGHEGPDFPGNMIVLCPNHHAAFDLATMALHPDSLDVYYLGPDGGLNNKGALCIQISGHVFDSECLTYSWNQWLRQLHENDRDVPE